MRRSLVIARRELSSMLRLPVGWVSAALFMLLTGVVVGASVLRPGDAASLRPFFSACTWLLLPVVPAVTMRLFSEEFRSGTIEPLLTSPASDGSVVIGKYLGAVGFLALLLVPTLIYPALLWSVSTPAPDIGPIIAGYLCLTLLGMLYVAVGEFVSSLTSNQTLAFLGTLFALIFLLALGTTSAPWIPRPVLTVLHALSIPARVSDFARGVIELSHAAFFIGASAWFVALTVVVLHSRRWR